MSRQPNQMPNLAAAFLGLTPAVARNVGRPEGQNVVEAPSRTSAKGDLTILKVRIAHVFSTFLLLASIVVLGGCSKKEEAAVPHPQPQPAPQAASQPAPQPVPQPASSPSSNALPSTQGEYPGVALTVQELKRSSSALTLKFVLQSKDNFNVSDKFGADPGFHNSVNGINLIDAANKKKYFVVLDTDEACVCSRDIGNISAGSQLSLWAKFPAPPDDVQKVTVVFPHFPPIEDVPITR
jgi:hypothetical protein